MFNIFATIIFHLLYCISYCHIQTLKDIRVKLLLMILEDNLLHLQIIISTSNKTHLYQFGFSYHYQPTFLQNLTFDFLLFSALSLDLLESIQCGWKRFKYTIVFLFWDICANISCYCLLKILDLPFCNLWQQAMLLNSKSDSTFPSAVK